MLSTIVTCSSPRKSFSALLAGTFSLLLVAGAQAQSLRAEDSFFIKPRAGMSWHMGDTEKTPLNFNMDAFDVGFPFSIGVELGYQCGQGCSLSLGVQSNNHPLSTHYGDEAPSSGDNGGSYTGAQFIYRTGSASRAAPFLALGAHVTTAGSDLASTTFGPLVGFGLDIVLNDRLSLVLEHLSNLTFPDDGFDGVAESPGDDGSFLPFDVSSNLALGLKISFESAITPVEILAVECPSTVGMGESGTFTVSTNADATPPIDVNWSFGDGGTATGMSAAHEYSSAGTYDVTVSAYNGKETVTATCSVRVLSPPSIVSIDASETQFELCGPTTVDFVANVDSEGTTTYTWDFGDGSTGTGAEASHTYIEVGEYTVTLTVENPSGTDTRSIQVTAESCIAAICYEITEMNPTYFDRNSSLLTAEGRAALLENVDVFTQCPNLAAEVIGYAAPGERNPQGLSEDRARAVEQFYVDNGLAASRFETEGRGLMPGTTKKEGASQARRVDTIPNQIEDM